MNISDIAAWWGAALASLVFGWDIYKWKTSGSRLAVKAVPNMQLVGDPDRKKSIFVEVVNRGDKLTTITHMAFYSYSSFWHRLFRRRKSQGLVPNPGGGAGLPFELDPGKRWTGMVDQQSVLSESKGGMVFVAIIHSGSRREVLRRLSLHGNF